MSRKHRGVYYVVLRTGGDQPVVLDSFRTYERAEEMCGVYDQKLTEVLGAMNCYKFTVQTSCYYDE